MHLPICLAKHPRSLPRAAPAALSAAALVLAAALNAAEPTPTATSAAVGTQGLVAHWTFDEGQGPTVRDRVRNLQGTIKGAAWTAGVSGSALRFDVSGAYVEINPDADLSLTEELTLAAWLKSENFDTPIVNKLTYYAPGNYDFRTERSGALSLSHENGPGQRMSHYESTARLAVGRWHHVAVTLKVGGDVNFYLDGHPAGTVPQKGRFGVVNAEPLRIGAKPDPYSSFHGVIDDVRIYRRALSAVEVTALASNFRPETPLAGREAGAAPVSAIRTTVVAPEGAHPVDLTAEWPQWQGPNRNGESTERGLLKRWPEGGPTLLWFTEGLGEGYSTVAIAGGRLYTTGTVGRQEVLFALDLNGRPLWQRTYGDAWEGRYPEARTTPTVNDGRVYVISGMGRIACFDALSGAEIWAVDAAKKFGTQYHYWGIAESPLVVGDRVIATPCGTEATFVALDKKSGATAWASKSLGELSGYCSPLPVTLQGRNLFITMLHKSIAGVDASSGEILWRLMYADYQKNPHGINPNSPVFRDGSFYTSSGYECGGARHQLSADGTKVTRGWTDRVLDSHHGGVVLVDGYLYGSNFRGHYDGNWVCLDWATGKVMYETKWLNKGAIIHVDGLLYCYEEKNGMVGLVRPSPERFEVISSFKVPRGTGPHWAHPVICGGRLYLRHGTALLVYNVRAPK